VGWSFVALQLQKIGKKLFPLSVVVHLAHPTLVRAVHSCRSPDFSGRVVVVQKAVFVVHLQFAFGFGFNALGLVPALCSGLHGA
jgi:hypothetical protein